MKSEQNEYKCTACKKDIKYIVMKCGECKKLFFHPGCINKPKIYKGKEYIRCDGPFERIINEHERSETSSQNKDYPTIISRMIKVGISIEKLTRT